MSNLSAVITPPKPTFRQKLSWAWQTLLGKDIKLSFGQAPINLVENIKEGSRTLGKVLSREYSVSYPFKRTNFFKPPYDLAEIGRVADVEPYVFQSVRKHRETILKQGYDLNGADDEMVKYCRDRLFEISVASGIPTDQWVRDLVSTLVTYHNAQIVLRRDYSKSSGRRIKLYGREIDPIAGIQIADPTTMMVKTDRYGTITRWRQEIDGDYREFDFRDVISIVVDRKAGTSFGTPYILPVIDDIRALRHLEEVAGLLATREGFPLYHIKVGTEKMPAMRLEGGGDELIEAESRFKQMPIGGVVTTSERYEIKIINSDGPRLDIIPFLDYFEDRVMAGLRLSGMEVGRGEDTNKGVATNLTQGIEDAALDYQKIIGTQLSNFLLFQLLLEGGYDVTQENLVSWDFKIINADERRANENHGSQLYMNSLITEDEARKTYLGKKPIPDDQRNRLFRDQETKANNETLALKNTLQNKNKPANQYGSRPKKRVKANDYIDGVALRVNKLTNSLLEIKGDDLENQITELFDSFIMENHGMVLNVSEELIQNGIDQACKALQKNEKISIGGRALDKFSANFLYKSFNKVLRPYGNQLVDLLRPDMDGNVKLHLVYGCIESLRKSLTRLARDQITTISRFGFAYGAKKSGYKSILLRDPESSNSKSIDVSTIVYKELIPTPSTEKWVPGLPE